LVGNNSYNKLVSKEKGIPYVKHKKKLYSSLITLPFSNGYLSTGNTNPNWHPKSARPVPALVKFFHNFDPDLFRENDVMEFILKLCHLKSITSSRTALPFQLRESKSFMEKRELS
jgi:hypothetical protein